MKRSLLLFIVVITIFLTGCLSPSINVSIEPEVTTINAGDTQLEGLVLKFKMSGFSFGYRLDEVYVEILDENGDQVTEQSQKLNLKIPVIAGVKKDVELDPISLDDIEYLTEAAYDEKLKGKDYTLKITVFGAKETSSTATIQFR